MRQYVIILIVTAIVFSNCDNEETIPSNDALIFPTSFEINIEAYEYHDSEGTIYTVKGDAGFPLVPDTVSDMPVIAWDSIVFRYVAAALFTSAIEVNEGEIKNTIDIVWQWHSGMNFERRAFIQYAEGCSVIDGVIDYKNPPIPLDEGHYYWAVWAWGNAGVRILFSSRQREFYVLK